MSLLYEKITEHGLEIPRALCEMARLTDQAAINVSEGKIEIRPLAISKEQAEALANKHIVLHLGDALLAGEPVLQEEQGIPIWKVPVLHSRTHASHGELRLHAESGTVLDHISATETTG